MCCKQMGTSCIHAFVIYDLSSQKSKGVKAMSDFELLSIVIMLIFGLFTLQFQTLSLIKDLIEKKYDKTKNSYPNRKVKQLSLAQNFAGGSNPLLTLKVYQKYCYYSIQWYTFLIPQTLLYLLYFLLNTLYHYLNNTVHSIIILLNQLTDPVVPKSLFSLNLQQLLQKIHQ